MAEPWLEAMGVIAGLLGIVAWVPQIIEVWKHKKHDGISLPTFFVVTCSLSLWLIYGIATESIAMIFANILTILVIILVITGVVKVRRAERKSSQ